MVYTFDRIRTPNTFSVQERWSPYGACIRTFLLTYSAINDSSIVECNCGQKPCKHAVALWCWLKDLTLKEQPNYYYDYTEDKLLKYPSLSSIVWSKRYP